MRFALLGSGSEGNALVVQEAGTVVLMDCGFTLGETRTRLERIGIGPEEIAAIVVTHEHGDHIGGVGRLARHYGLPVWLTHGTRRVHAKSLDGVAEIREIDSHSAFSIGDIEVQPYVVPHDAAEPVQYVFGNGSRRLGVLTDAGCITPHIEAMLDGCDALVLECNHDAGMLTNGDYPYSLKQRVGGRSGHLSNDQAAALLGRIDGAKLQHLIAAHLSQSNNLPELARRALSAAMGCGEEWIAVANQEDGLDWRAIA